MLLYHGSAEYEAIARNGLSFDRERANSFGEGEYLASCGGIYFSDSLEVAAFYANNAASGEQSIGGDPCVFAVEIDESLLVADEDKMWDAMRVICESIDGRRFKTDLTIDEAKKYSLRFIGDKWEELFGQVCRKFLIRQPSSEDGQAVKDAVRAFVIRGSCFEWSLDGSFEQEIQAIDEFCRLAAPTISRRWLSEHYDDFSLTCRTYSDVAPMSSDSPVRIVGSIVLRMDTQGLAVSGISFDGVFDEEDVEEFQDAFIEKCRETAGCDIEAFDLDDLDPSPIGALSR